MKPSNEPVSIRTLQTGSYGSGQTAEPQIALAADENRYRALWQAAGGGATPPPVDFAKESVVFISLGERPTGGYAVEAVSATVEGAVARIVVETKGPPAGAMVTQALTYPFAVVAIATPRLERAEWIDRDGRVVAREDIRTR